MGEGAAGVVGLQLGGGLFMGFGDDHATAFKAAAALLQGPGDIGEVLFGMRAQMRGKRGGIGIKCCFGAARDGQERRGPLWDTQSLKRSLTVKGEVSKSMAGFGAS